MPSFDVTDWHRVQFQKIPIYLHRNQPDWFVPSESGDRVLQRLNHGPADPCAPAEIGFLERLPENRVFDFPGRAAFLKLEQIRELWFHITNRCNLTCTHCLFASSPKETSQLSGESVLHIARDAAETGCKLFVLTGGEPFVHPEIFEILEGLLSIENSHVVILTNGVNLPAQLFSGRYDMSRLHLQVSIDGIAERHDQIRGKGSFRAMHSTLMILQAEKIPLTLSMCVSGENVQEMPAVVDFAASVGAGNVHFMWYFVSGRGKAKDRVPVNDIFENLVKAADRAEHHQIRIDNIESLKTQIFAPSGTFHDGSTAGWESLAVGPDGRLYPSAALVGIAALSTPLQNGIQTAWRQSPVLQEIRNSTAADFSSPFRFLLGGGDMDHSYLNHKTFMGDDPYEPLYEKTALWLIAREARLQPENGLPQIRLRMGEILESCGAHGKIALTHANCLLAFAGKDSLTTVKNFYATAAGDQKKEILNPVCYDSALISHIPEPYRFRGYGCGSPVLDANIEPGAHVVDLGCGSGVECFIAARITGPRGRVTGVDMLDPMLALARKARKEVAENLGYDNIRFEKGYLEDLPLEENTADVVLSNCVMNLSVHKRRAYREIHRILKPGARLVISDVVCETEPDSALRNDETLRGECIAGAMTQTHLTALLESIGFQAVRLIKRFPYRTVGGHPFFSLTYTAVKPQDSEKVNVIYRGPLPHIITHDGTMLLPGRTGFISRHEAMLLNDQVFIVDETGFVLNHQAENACACSAGPERKAAAAPLVILNAAPRFSAGCMVCGAPMEYLADAIECECAYCQNRFFANSRCRNGHYVCDPCHGKDGFQIISHLCATARETDMIHLLAQIRRHPSMPVHGPEHHALIPGIILAAYRNLGGDIPASRLETAIRRGSTVAGGYCGFMGICGAAVGVGIAFGLILDATPVKPKERKSIQTVTAKVLGEIAKFRAARCCQRESWLALKKAAELSITFLPISLKAEGHLACSQQERNKECFGKGCPLHP